MTHSRLFQSVFAAGACAAVGTIAGIAASAAAPAHSQDARGASYAAEAQGPATLPAPASIVRALPGKLGFGIAMGGPPVHAVQIVPNKTGTGFDTVTLDSGTVKSVSGSSLTITEGTDKATYATPTLSIPGDATVERNFQSAKLSEVQPGDHVDVSSSSDGTTNVFAVDAEHWPPKPLALSKLGGPPMLLPGRPLTPAPSGPTEPSELSYRTSAP